MSNKKNNKNNKILDKFRDNYKFVKSIGKHSNEYEVWRKNPKGFYNVVAYITDLSAADSAIIADQEQLKKNKKSKHIEIEEEDD